MVQNKVYSSYIIINDHVYLCSFFDYFGFILNLVRCEPEFSAVTNSSGNEYKITQQQTELCLI